MEKREISQYLVAIYFVFKNRPDQWMSNADVAAVTHGIRPRTVRAHTHRLAKLGVLDESRVFPGNYYRLAVKRNEDAEEHCRRLERAAQAFGMTTAPDPSAEATPNVRVLSFAGPMTLRQARWNVESVLRECGLGSDWHVTVDRDRSRGDTRGKLRVRICPAVMTETGRFTEIGQRLRERFDVVKFEILPEGDLIKGLRPQVIVWLR
jgi:DNA-binding transcriptional ArsR family regulator